MHKGQILKYLRSAVEKKYHPLIEVFTPDLSEHGDYSTNIAMRLAREMKKSPREIAGELKGRIEGQKPEMLSAVEVANSGYLNFFLKETILRQNLARILADQERYGRGLLYQGQKVMIEYAHPNPFKIMHIGHLRNIILGESLVRLFEAQGATVIRANYQGDVGMHVAKCVWALARIPEEKLPRETDKRVGLLGKCYAEGAKAYEEDEQAKEEIQTVNRQIYEQSDKKVIRYWNLGREWSLDKFREVYNRLYTHFDREYLESETLELGMRKVKEALDKGILVKSQGAVVFPGDMYGLDTRVFLNKQGHLTYEGKELGLVYLKHQEYGKLDQHVNNVAVEQISFFKVVYKVEELLDPDLFKGVNYHNAYEFVGLKKGKMSSRTGQVVPAEAILDEAEGRIEDIVEKNRTELTEEAISDIAVAAIKYAYLRMSPFKYLAFDIDASVSFSGDSGPYLQYTYARAKSILRKSEEGKEAGSQEASLAKEESDLLKKLYQFPEVVEDTILKYSPNYIAGYLNELAQAFNNFYSKHQVIGNRFRLELTAGVAQVIQNGLYLLGIKAVERM